MTDHVIISLYTFSKTSNKLFSFKAFKNETFDSVSFNGFKNVLLCHFTKIISLCQKVIFGWKNGNKRTKLFLCEFECKLKAVLKQSMSERRSAERCSGTRSAFSER